MTSGRCYDVAVLRDRMSKLRFGGWGGRACVR